METHYSKTDRMLPRQEETSECAGTHRRARSTPRALNIRGRANSSPDSSQWAFRTSSWTGLDFVAIGPNAISVITSSQRFGVMYGETFKFPVKQMGSNPKISAPQPVIVFRD